jgi:hypothetical protein
VSSDGNIRHPVWATRAKEYAWDRLADVFPRGITPTDIDGIVEINRCFFIFEGKTYGTHVENGQGRCLRGLLQQLGPAAIVAVGEHQQLDRVDIASGVLRCQYGWWRSDQGMRWGEPMPGPGCLWSVAAMFVEDSRTGTLRPESWQERMTYLGRPFTEP